MGKKVTRNSICSLCVDCRDVLLPMILDQMNDLFPRHEELDICVRTLGDMLNMFYNNTEMVCTTFTSVLVQYKRNPITSGNR